jgi:hypothetical protein
MRNHERPLAYVTGQQVVTARCWTRPTTGKINVMEPRLEFKTEAFQAILDETAKVDPRAKKIKPALY